MQKKYGTTHIPHGWLGLNANGGVLSNDRFRDLETPYSANRGEQMWKVREANARGFDYCVDGGVLDTLYPSSETRRGRVKENGLMCGTIQAEGIPSRLEAFKYEVNGEEYSVRIRKLTPRECWRLMSFSDEDFEKAEAVNSNTQLYKQAGNSIVKDVLMAIFREML